MHAMTLHAQADLWQYGAATFAALFMEGEMRSPDTEVDRTDVLFYGTHNYTRVESPVAEHGRGRADRRTPCSVASTHPILRSYGPPGMSHTIRSQEDDVPGVPPENLAETDLLRELEHLHTTRHGTFLHGAPDALREHTNRTAQLEEEYLRRHPEREVDPARTRSGARGEDGSEDTRS